MYKTKLIIYFLLTFCALCPFTGKAQIGIGVKSGLNVFDNYQTGTKYYSSSPQIGFHFGGFGDYGINDKLSVRLEALLSTRGLFLKEFQGGNYVKYKRESLYLDVPISASYNVWNNISLHGGFLASVFIQEFRSETSDQNGFRVESPSDQFKSYKRIQIGSFVGASYPFTLFDKDFEAGMRYSFALTPTNQLIRDARAGRDPKYMMFQLHLAYKFLNLEL